MNRCDFYGTLCKDFELRENGDKSVARSSMALNRIGEGADFINLVAFGKTAINLNKYFHKGSRIAVSCHVQTGSYEKNGAKVYTTDFIIDSFDFVDKKSESEAPKTDAQGWEAIGMEIDDEELPFN